LKTEVLLLDQHIIIGQYLPHIWKKAALASQTFIITVTKITKKNLPKKHLYMKCYLIWL